GRSRDCDPGRARRSEWCAGHDHAFARSGPSGRHRSGGHPSNLPPVTAPTVVILAAGQGTRMRSRTPKMLHHICGRPMIDWTVAAALEAGAAKVVVVGSPDRVLDGRLPDGVVLAVQPEPNGT